MAGAVPGERTSRLQHSAEVTVSLATSELRAELVEGDATSTTRRGGRRPWNTRRHDLRLVRRAVRAAAAGSSSGVWTRCAAGGSAMHAYIAFSSSRRAATARVCAQSVPVTRTELTITARTSRVTHGSRSESCKRAGRARDAPAGSGQVNGRPVSPLESVRVGSPGHADDLGVNPVWIEEVRGPCRLHVANVTVGDTLGLDPAPKFSKRRFGSGQEGEVVYRPRWNIVPGAGGKGGPSRIWNGWRTVAAPT